MSDPFAAHARFLARTQACRLHASACTKKRGGEASLNDDDLDAAIAAPRHATGVGPLYEPSAPPPRAHPLERELNHPHPFGLLGGRQTPPDALISLAVRHGPYRSQANPARS